MSDGLNASVFIFTREHGQENGLLPTQSEELRHLIRMELFALFILIEKILVNFLASKHPNIGVVRDCT